MDEIVSKNGEFVEPTVPVYRSALPGEAPLVNTWAAQAEVGWVPTTLLDPYLRADREYELYRFLTEVFGGFLLTMLLTWWLMPERTEKWYVLAGVMVPMLVLVGLSGGQMCRQRKQKKHWLQAIEAKRVPFYTSSETARSIQNEE